MLNNEQRQRIIDFIQKEKEAALSKTMMRCGINLYQVEDDDLLFFNNQGIKVIKKGRTTKLKYESRK